MNHTRHETSMTKEKEIIVSRGTIGKDERVDKENEMAIAHTTLD